MKEIIKNTLILFAITLVSGLLLGVVYEVTKNPRKEQEELAKQKAYKTVFEDSHHFIDVEYDSKKVDKLLSKSKVDGIVAACDKKDNILGYVITITNKEGYGGDITLAVGIRNDKTINGISILSINETAGLGMEAKEKYFTKQFADKKVDRFVYTKSGANADNEIDVISSATVTTNAVTNAVNSGIICFEYLTDGGGNNE